MSSILVALVSGLVFGAGLLVSGMAQPAKVIGFLDLSGAWDPTLAFVMVGAIAVHLVAYRLVARLPSPLLDGAWALPTRRDVDSRLILGAMLFGGGWGLGGYCPGPALTTFVSGASSTLLFTGSMLVAMWGHALWTAASERR